jgi:single-strand DNA-binding protein
MFDTYVTVVGTVLHQPEKRVTNKSNALVATFKVATHPRRYDPKTERWVDAPSLRIRVNCWRRLAEHVAMSVNVGDSVVVYGRISTREWKTEQGEPRLSYEMDADNVGHDLSRGTATFVRARPEGNGSVVDDEDTNSRVNGEPTSPVGAHGSGGGDTDGASDEAGHDDRPFDDDFGYGESYASAPDADADALQILRGLDDVVGTGGDEDAEDEEDVAGAVPGSGGSGGRGRRRGRQPVPA